MKPGVIYSALLFWIFIFISFDIQAQITPEVKKAFDKGNSQQLAKYFSKNIELFIIQKEDVYSKAQAELIIKDFFAKHLPDRFIIEDEGNSDGIHYAIGNLTTAKGKFRIYLTYKVFSGRQYINRINISEYK